MRERTSAQALVWLTLMLPIFLSTVGLAIDGGILLMSHRQLQSVADGAARAGATRVDVERLRSTGGADVQLDQTNARAIAFAYLADGLQALTPSVDEVTPTLDVQARQVSVTLDGTAHTAFLRIAHIDEVPVSVTARANILYGIRTGRAE